MTDLEEIEKNKINFNEPPKKWMIVAFYKNGKIIYGKNRFDTEQGAHNYYKAMARKYPKHIKAVSYYLVMPAKDKK